jgi:predicted RNA-binding protein YlxR (DUF448 family)
VPGLPIEPGERGVPTRTCVGCRIRDAQDRLLRVVAVEGEVLPDPRRRLTGRGAYLHPSPECLALAERKRAFPRAFRLPGPLAVGAVRASLDSTTGTSTSTST